MVENDVLVGEVVSPSVSARNKTRRARRKDEKQEALDNSAPVDGDAAIQAIKETTITDLERGAAWAEVKILEYRAKIRHRNMWSYALLVLVIFIVVMDFLIVLLEGLGFLKYSSTLAIPAFIGSSILEIFGLSYIVVQYLFPNEEKDNNEQETIQTPKE